MDKFIRRVVVALLLTLLIVPQVNAESVSPSVDQTVGSIPPGPGLPSSWQTPAPPSSIPQELVDKLREYQQASPRYAPTGQILYVTPELKSWTHEFPWRWEISSLDCGRTQVVFAIPVPDLAFIQQSSGKLYSFFRNASNPNTCTFGGVQVIQEEFRATPEEMEQARLEGELSRDIWKAQLEGPTSQRLNPCGEDYVNGTVATIHVCFNEGNASERFDVSAYLDTSVNRVRVPIRFVSEMMGGTVTWNPDTQTVTIDVPAVERLVTQPDPLPGYTVSDRVIPNSSDFRSSTYHLVQRMVQTPSRRIQLVVGQSDAYVDGQRVRLDAPPVIRDGRTMVPLRFIAESLGAKVYWVGATPIFDQWDGRVTGTYQVHIYTPFWPYFDYPNWFLETRAQRF